MAIYDNFLCNLCLPQSILKTNISFLNDNHKVLDILCCFVSRFFNVVMGSFTLVELNRARIDLVHLCDYTF